MLFNSYTPYHPRRSSRISDGRRQFTVSMLTGVLKAEMHSYVRLFNTGSNAASEQELRSIVTEACRIMYVLTQPTLCEGDAEGDAGSRMNHSTNSACVTATCTQDLTLTSTRLSVCSSEAWQQRIEEAVAQGLVELIADILVHFEVYYINE